MNNNYVKKTTKIKIIVPAIILIVLGIIVCVSGFVMVWIITGMPDSIGAYYFNDMLSVIAGSPLYPLICGVCYLLTGIIALIFSKRQGRGNLIRIVGIVFIAVYVALFFIFVFAVTTPAFLGIVVAGLTIAIFIFTDMNIYLLAEKDVMFSFDTSITAEAKAIKNPVYEIAILGKGDLPLPRGLKNWHGTIEDIRAAYPLEGFDDGFWIVHNYVYFDKIAMKQELELADIGSIRYCCDVDGILCQVFISLPSRF